MGRGIVYLVGAGPGDPGCLTLRGRDCLRRAEVVVYDYLANEELLQWAPSTAEMVFAGKHGRGVHLLDQEEINRALVDAASAGKVVVRLKGGDPLVFGRGGEEAEALVRAGLPFEVVPGVSAALSAPAFAGIPLTHRDWVSGFTVLTGHQAAGLGRIDWERVASAGNTIVILMSVAQMRRNADLLREGGLAADTPVAAIQWASRPWQNVVTGTLATIADEVEGRRLRPPVTLVIGDVVRLRESLGWFEGRPLFGRRILVTRAAAQARPFVDRLAEAGAHVLTCPALEIETLSEGRELLGRAIGALESYDWLLFTSVNGVEVFFGALLEEGRDLRALGSLRIGVIGAETGRAVGRRHLRADVVPGEFRAEGLLEALGAEAMQGKRVLLPRALGARAILPDTLRKWGAEVDEISTYRSIVPDGSAKRLAEILEEGPLDCLTFTSSSTVSHFVELLERVRPGAREEVLAGCRVACIGPITAATARDAGLPVDIVPDEYTITMLSDAIAASFDREES